LLAALAMTVAACDGTASEAPSTKASVKMSVSTGGAMLSPPPLRLPSVAPGGTCPTTTPHRWTGTGVATNVLGTGPLYPVADYFRNGGATLELREEDRTPDGSYQKKVRWLGRGYTGPVLLRAARIDGPGTAHAEFAYLGQQRWHGYYVVLTDAENDLPAGTTVSGPGCYAYQVDGTTFSETIIFRAVAAG
jgi:hypothetical protein